jgi:hypothetical protein
MDVEDQILQSDCAAVAVCGLRAPEARQELKVLRVRSPCALCLSNHP